MGGLRNVGGHTVERTGKAMKGHPGNPPELRCTGCGTTGDHLMFTVGTYGCPGDPASFALSVCPGGDRCDGHMVIDSAEYRAWKAIPSVSPDTVPRRYHDAPETRQTGLAYRAASEYIEYADLVGVQFSVWAQEGFKVGPDGGKVAEMTFRGEPWSVWVDHFGHIIARPGN